MLDRNGRPLRQLGGRELREPAGVAVSVDGKTVLVADTANHRCRVRTGVVCSRDDERRRQNMVRVWLI